MMKKAIFGKLSVMLTFCSPFYAYAVQNSCIDRGFLPENNMKIPVNAFDANSMTEAQFNSILDRIESLYKPVVAAKGGTLTFKRAWSDGTVNAYASREGNSWIVQMFGGLARHAAITNDGFALVACHELGHHLGGAPKYAGDWAAGEGQADYFATLKCLRRVWENDDNSGIISKINVAPSVRTSCEKSFSDRNTISLCIRSAYAGLSSANLSIALGAGQSADFDTPDPKRVSSTDTSHPEAQCRLDTYYNGGVCQVAVSEDVSETDPTVGTCAMEKGATFGYRPLCWYKPSGSIPTPDPTTTPTPVPTSTPIPDPQGVANQPTISGKTSASSSPYVVVPIDFDVSNVKGAKGVYFEVVGPDQYVSEPNGVNPDQNRIFWQSMKFTRGRIYVTAVSHFPYYGTYYVRVIALDASGRYAVGRFSSASTLLIQ